MFQTKLYAAGDITNTEQGITLSPGWTLNRYAVHAVAWATEAQASLASQSMSAGDQLVIKAVIAAGADTVNSMGLIELGTLNPGDVVVLDCTQSFYIDTLFVAPVDSTGANVGGAEPSIQVMSHRSQSRATV